MCIRDRGLGDGDGAQAPDGPGALAVGGIHGHQERPHQGEDESGDVGAETVGGSRDDPPERIDRVGERQDVCLLYTSRCV